MKKTTKNPITFFREANEKRQAAVRNSLRKAQFGYMGSLSPSEKKDLENNPVGPRTEAQTNYEDPMAYGRGPRTTSLRQDINQEMRDITTNKSRNAMLDQMTKDNPNIIRMRREEMMKEIPSNYDIDPSTGKMYKTSPDNGKFYKKGGSVKPSAGLSKKTKSNIAKKASAGKDIGKKGKGFAKVAAAAGGGQKGKRIAAAAMWKNIKRG